MGGDLAATALGAIDHIVVEKRGAVDELHGGGELAAIVVIRTGQPCARPVMECFQLPETARASFAFYNTLEEIDRLAAGVERARKLFA